MQSNSKRKRTTFLSTSGINLPGMLNGEFFKLLLLLSRSGYVVHIIVCLVRFSIQEDAGYASWAGS